MNNFGELVSFIWNVADLLRGPYKAHQYGRVILPMTVLRRLDCVLEPTKQKVLEKAKGTYLGPVLQAAAGQHFYNNSRYDFQKLLGDAANIASNLTHYIQGFFSRGSRHSGAFQVRGRNRHARRAQPPVSGRQEVRRDRSAPEPRLEPRDGLRLRGADPPV